MVGFGKRIKCKAPKGWESLMLDYSLLKSRLEMASKVESLDGSQHGRTDSKVALALRNSFQHLLDSELEKVLAHYSLYSARLCSRVEGLKAETSVASQFFRQGLGPSELAELTKDVKTLAELWVEQAGKLRMLLQYLTLNLEGLRKILKKYKKSNAVGVSPRPGLVTLRLDHPSLPGGFVEQGSFLPLDMVEQINAMKDHDELVEASQTVRAVLLELDAMKRQLSEAAGRSGGKGRIVGQSIYGAFSQEARNHGSVQRSLSMLRSQLSSLEDLDAVERRARAAAAVITPMAHFETRAAIFTPAPPDHAAYATVPGLLINLASAFLYMTNYSLVLPTNEEFLEHIGSRGSMAGVCVGMADITAVFVSLLYGWWSNRSFKQPLIASSLLCLTGNVVYCFAWDAHAGIALPMLLAGRLLTGMGSCRGECEPSPPPILPPILLTSGTLSSDSISGEQALHRGLCVLEEADCRLRSLCCGQRRRGRHGTASRRPPPKYPRFQDCGILHQLDHGRRVFDGRRLARLHHLPAGRLRGPSQG